MRYCTFIFSLSCSIASVTSYLSEKRLKIYKIATPTTLKFLILKWNISRTIWSIEVGDGLLFCIFHALSFELHFFFDRRFALTLSFFLSHCSTGWFHPFHKIRSRHPRALKLSELIAYMIFYKITKLIWKFRNSDKK